MRSYVLSVFLAPALVLTACGARAELEGPRFGRTGPTSYRSYTAAPTSIAFEDACALPGHRNFLANIDDNVVSTALPFEFHFYDQTSTVVWFNSDGLVGFNTVPSRSFLSVCGGSPGRPGAVFAPLWQDLVTRAAGVCMATAGEPGSRRVVLTWSDTILFSAGGPSNPSHITFSATLYEGRDVLEVAFQQLDGGPVDAALGAAVGVYRDDSEYTEFACHRRAAVTVGSAVRFTPVP